MRIFRNLTIRLLSFVTILIIITFSPLIFASYLAVEIFIGAIQGILRSKVCLQVICFFLAFLWKGIKYGEDLEVKLREEALERKKKSFDDRNHHKMKKASPKTQAEFERVDKEFEDGA